MLFKSSPTLILAEGRLMGEAKVELIAQSDTA